MSPVQEYSKVIPLFMSPFLVKAMVGLFHASHLAAVRNVKSGSRLEIGHGLVIFQGQVSLDTCMC